MPLEMKKKFFFDTECLDRAMEVSEPFYKEGKKLKKFTMAEQMGWWSLISVRGSKGPTARENASMFVQNRDGYEFLVLVGGSKSTIGPQ